ncbi:MULTISPECIES: DUF427 domain-containing protein [Cyanophyceae]|uniref:DUF427 domain-containing protein n=1 Tax=Leptolyngbya subtilissima DQ-A4 TaxID=2933933 RepID=A0ABV0JXY9_9CYAN|nr:DUF427 domain-containing protein [Nodosilinea sp. FACHB-141]MBD2112019.1 DUF427 domain-containing protein [Nodosilinea sp. FACHB-141]
MFSPPNRIAPGPGQESVWDYPRPPRLEDSTRHIRVVFNGVVIADSRRTKRVLETSHPPTYYIPPEDVQMQYFQSVPRSTFCEWKGAAVYFTIAVGERVAEQVAWAYPQPTEAFESIANYIALYPSRMEACYVDDELVKSQPGDFYGGWITSDIVGPFKGDPGTWGW